MLNRRMFARILPFLAGFAARGGSLVGAPPANLPNASPEELKAWFFMADPLPSFVARDWARYFVALLKVKPEIARDEEIVNAWFAAALMRGYEEHARASRMSDVREKCPKCGTFDNARISYAVGKWHCYKCFLVEKNGELAVENERLRDYRDRVEGALV